MTCGVWLRRPVPSNDDEPQYLSMIVDQHDALRRKYIRVHLYSAKKLVGVQYIHARTLRNSVQPRSYNEDRPSMEAS